MRTNLVDALVKEIWQQQHYLSGETIETIYFGGGTPSLLLQNELTQLLDAVRSTQRLSVNSEITLEANPDDLTPVRLKEFLNAGINRLSIGIQSFRNGTLAFLNRAHNGGEAISAFNQARDIGFKNISIDLIYAIPDQTDEHWASDIQTAIQLSPEHLSCYSLTIEEKTVFGKWSVAGKIKPTEEETASRHLVSLMEALEGAGYEHYEISNFAKPGFQSKHNSSYWKEAKYLGIGPSAHSFNGVSRQYNISNNSLYLKSINQGAIPFEREELTRADKINEYILTTLRTNWGTDLEKMKREFQYDIQKENNKYLNELLEEEFATLKGGILMLTKKGKLLADKISSDLFLIDHEN